MLLMKEFKITDQSLKRQSKVRGKLSKNHYHPEKHNQERLMGIRCPEIHSGKYIVVLKAIPMSFFKILIL